jgi:hypothetical protein
MRCTPIGKGDLLMVESSVSAIRNRPIGKQRRKALLAGVEERPMALHVQVCLLLSSKARIGQIFRGSAAAHRDVRRVHVATPQPRVGVDDFRFQILRQFNTQDCLSHLAGALTEVLEVACIKIAKNLFDFLVETRFAQNIAIRISGDRKAVRHFDAFGCQFSAHLAQRGILAADERNVIDANFVEPSDVFGPLCAGLCDRGFKCLRCHNVSSFRY